MNARADRRPSVPERPASPWILSAPRDLLLFVATPLLIVPVIHVVQERWTSAQLYLFVASFGAIGHHLPGLLRAYGDRALFGRFRTRFVVAPLLLLAGCILLAFHARSALILAVFAWGAWHGAMQVHGFARIYDSKAGSTARLTARLDQALVLSCFATAIAWSDLRVHYLLERGLEAGLPAPSAAAVDAVRLGVAAIAALVVVAWVANAVARWRAGSPPSPIKILLLVLTVAFYAHVNLVIHDLLIAVVLFEIFHDVQYLSIVWLFNRRRAASGEDAGALTRWLFRPRAFLLLAYVGLCFAYGGLNIAQSSLADQALATVLVGVLAASTFLHFYYDGFIWKLRDADTRAGLGLAAAQPPPRTWRAQGALRHAAAWGLLFVLPLGVMAATTPRAVPEDERHLLLAATLPRDAGALRNAAVALERRGDRDAALAAARRAHDLGEAGGDEATATEARATLASLLMAEAVAAARAGRLDGARASLTELLVLDPRAADRLSDSAAERLSARDPGGAEATCRALLDVAPEHGPCHHNMAVALAAQGRLPEARAHAARAVALLADPAPAREVLRRIEAALAVQSPGAAPR